jgi:hypothetical protein
MPYQGIANESYLQEQGLEGTIVTVTQQSTTTQDIGDRAARISLWLLWWAPISVVVGFAWANRFLSETWPLWQVVPLAIALAIPFGIGAFYGLRAARLGVRRGWVISTLQILLMVMALVMPISEATS